MEEKIEEMEKEINELKKQIKNLTSIVEDLKGPEVKGIYINLRPDLDEKQAEKGQETEKSHGVGFKSFDEIRKENEEWKANIIAANNALNGIPYQPTIAEEMNLDTDSNFRYIGKGPLY